MTLLRGGLIQKRINVPALNALTLSIPFDGSIGSGTFARTGTAWNPETGAVAPHNYLLQSNGLDQAGWNKDTSGGSLPVVTAGQPDRHGGTTAFRLQLDRGAGTFSRFYQNPATLVAFTGAAIRGLWLKSNTGVDQQVTIRCGTAATNVQPLITVTPVWQFFSVTSTFSAAQAGLEILSFSTTGGTVSVDILAMEAQINAYALTDYIPTTTAAVYSPRYVSGKSGQAILIEEASTNVFLNSVGTAAVTQDIALTTAGSGKWTCSVIGAGTVTSSAGTATATGYGAASAGSNNTVTITGNGTVTYTVAGANATTKVQVENLAYATSHIVTAGSPVTRNAETLTYPTSGVLTAAQGTVALWVNIDTTKQADSAYHFMFSTHTSALKDRITLFKNNASNQWSVQVGNATPSYSTHTVTNALSSGWHLMSMTWNTTELALWIDGIKQASPISNPVAPSSIGTNFFVGANESSVAQADMPIDSVRIYNRALTAAEVLQLYRYGR